MGLTKFKIVFNNSWKTYYPGQTVTGDILISLNSPRKIHGIKLRIKGEALTTWTIYESGGTMSRSVTLTGHEEYFHYKYYVLGSAYGQDIELEAGEHKYPFTFELPTKLPCSFEHKFGHVRYTINATLDRASKFDQEVKAVFSIVSDYDLNTDMKASEPVSQLLSKTFGYFCYGSSPLRVNIKMPIKGFVPGQAIPITIDVDNNTAVLIDRIKLILWKKVTFRVKNPKKETKQDKIVIAENDISPIERGENSYEESIIVPPIPPSNLSHCGIIDIEYFVKVEACAHGLHANLVNNTPIIIGTIPMKKFKSKIDYPSSTKYGPDELALIPSCALYPGLPPPSFEETSCVVQNLKEPGDTEHVMGNNHFFAPKYPVYDFKNN